MGWDAITGSRTYDPREQARLARAYFARRDSEANAAQRARQERYVRDTQAVHRAAMTAQSSGLGYGMVDTAQYGRTRFSLDARGTASVVTGYGPCGDPTGIASYPDAGAPRYPRW